MTLETRAAFVSFLRGVRVRDVDMLVGVGGLVCWTCDVVGDLLSCGLLFGHVCGLTTLAIFGQAGFW